MKAIKIVFAGLLALGLGACASQPTELGDASDAAKVDDKTCLRDTGTKIKRKEGDDRCVNAPGRVYTEEELQQTGAATVGEALRKVGR